MAKNIYFSIFLVLATLWSIQSQDVHLTNYQTNSPFFNPAQSGDFRGSTRIGASFRTQYVRTYEHGIVHADINLYSPFHKKHWASVGIQLIYDITGSLRLSQTGGGLNMAYHIPFGKKDKHTVSFGANISLYSLGINTEQYLSETLIAGGTDPDLEALESFSGRAFSTGAGVRLLYHLNKTSNIHIGLAMLHINEPAYSVISDKTSLGRRINTQILWSKCIGSLWKILPAINFSYTENHSNTNLQLNNEYKLNKNYNWALLGGLGYRFGESMDILFGYKTNKMMAALSVDVLTGKVADVVNNLGAFELSAYYIFEKDVKPKAVPVILCPRI